MKYKILEVETNLFNRNIIQLDQDTDSEEFKMYEHSLIKDLKPYYIQHQFYSGDLTKIHAFEEIGFRFVEFRIYRFLQLLDQTINTRHHYPYGCELIGNNKTNKKAIIDIVAQYSSDDRFTCDPLISNELARKRLELYITKSLTSFPRQFLFGLINKQSNEIIGFKTGIFVNPTMVRYFYYFMKKGYNYPNYNAMLETGVLEALIKKGVHIVEAVTSGTNVQEMNDSVHFQKYIIDKTMILLRKIY